MMHGPEKSDLLVIPKKPVNKAGRSAAESVEGRSETKGNVELQSTVRTQSRAAVSQAQGCIREAVNRNNKEKLTALLHHISIDVLRGGFLSLKKRAAAGVDSVTWNEYAETLEDNLRDLHRRVQSGAYRALPSRRVYIPKADGKGPERSHTC
jgi:RNA-directed DNA polymerase